MSIKAKMQLLWNRRKEERGIKVERKYFFPLHWCLPEFLSQLHWNSRGRGQNFLTILWCGLVATLSSLLWAFGKPPAFSACTSISSSVTEDDKRFCHLISVLRRNLQSDTRISCLGWRNGKKSPFKLMQEGSNHQLLKNLKKTNVISLCGLSPYRAIFCESTLDWSMV